MTRRKITMVLIGLMLTVVLAGCSGGKSKIQTFSEWTDVELFQTVPAMVVEETTIGEAVDYGADNYVITVEGTKKADYDAYVSLLAEEGFKKYVDNGEGFDQAVFNTTFQKDDVTLTVIHLEKASKTYVSVSEGQPLSKHLFYNDSYLEGNVEGAQTKLHMVELYYFGSSFIIQLKNGHFIINDGGTDYDTPYLFDYLESLTPDGEKPVVEAWVISHAHYDHIRVFDPLITKKEYADRIYVEGFYFNEPSDEANNIETAVKTELLNLDGVKNILKTTDGGHPEVYRIRTGERYYFNDITMDVMLTQEQLLVSDYEDGYNETSSWVLYTIEGQTVLIGGDAGAAGMKGIMNAYSQDYLTVNMFSALHHGHNTRGDFTKYCKVKDVVLYSERSFAGGGANEVLKEQAAESFVYGDGTKVLTFPYTIGTTESLPCNTWQYHIGQVRPSL